MLLTRLARKSESELKCRTNNLLRGAYFWKAWEDENTALQGAYFLKALEDGNTSCFLS